MPPRSKNGSKISSFVSLNTRDGGGRVEPARRQTSSQNSSSSATTISGGTTRTAVSRAILPYFSDRGADFGFIVTTGAAMPGEVTGMAVAVASLFIACIDIEIGSPRFNERAARLPRGPAGSDFDTLDGKRLQIRRWIFRIEHLAVEEGLLAAGGRGRNIGRRNAELLGGVLPEVFAVHLFDQRLAVEAGLVFAPADILRHEPEVMALERIGSLVAPEPHDMRRVLDHLAGDAVVELALHAIGDVVDGAIDPLPLGADRRDLVAIFRFLAPLLGFHHGHQQRLRGLRIFVDIGRAHAEGFFRMLVPELAGRDGGVADVLMDELQVPRL